MIKDTDELRIYNKISQQDINKIKKFADYIINKLTGKDYQEFKYVNSGTFSDVYKYKNFAIKIFKNIQNVSLDLNGDEEVLSKLNNISLFPKLFLGCKEFIVMEYIDGKELYSCKNEDLYTCNKNSIKELLNGIKQSILLDIIPNDVHTQNILLTNNGEFKIVDVGLFNIKKINNLLEIILSLKTEEEINEWVLGFLHLSTQNFLYNLEKTIKKGAKIHQIA